MALWLQGCGKPPAVPPARVILLVVDSLRADHLGYIGYGRPLSPMIDAIAARSVNFRWAFAPSNVTPRSVTAFMTGKYYSSVLADSREDGLPQAGKSLAEAFQENSFRNLGWGANYFLTAAEGQNQAFDHYTTFSPPAAGTISSPSTYCREEPHDGQIRILGWGVRSIPHLEPRLPENGSCA